MMHPRLMFTCSAALRGALVALALLSAAPAVSAGQASQAQIEFVRAELGKRGLTESEARTRLAQSGINIDQIPLNELPQYQGRIVAILDQLAAEKRAAGQTGTPVVQTPLPTAASSAAAAAASTAPITTAAEAAADAAQRAVTARTSDDGIYGHDIFSDQTLEVFRTTDGARAPDTYVLGAGDQVRISIFGSSQADLASEIGADGFVQFDGVPKVYLSGLTLAQARPLIRDRLSSFYTFNADQFVVALQTARTVTVNVFGETKVRGSFTVSALNTALNALAASGGPTAIGSVRAIELVRGSVRRRLDVYAFLNDPKLIFAFDLQHNDILFVPVAKTIVTLQGAVRRPLRYELVDGEDLAQLLRFAGGVNFNSNPDQVQVQRVEGDSVVLRDYRLRDLLDGTRRVALQDGDVVRVGSIGRTLEQVVQVEGAVYYDGQYGLSETRTLGELLAKAQPRQDAASNAYVIRTNPLNREELSYLRVDLSRDQAFVLQPLDRVSISSRSVFTEVGDLSVSGAVQRGTTRLVYDPTLTVRDLITLAGGLTLRSATNRVDVFRLRVDLNKGSTFDRISLQLDSSYAVVSGPANFRLQPFDQLVVRDIPLFDTNRNVQIAGQVLYPGAYALRNERTYLSEVLREAGGLTDMADPQFAVVLRDGVGPVAVDLRRTLASPKEESADPILLPGDVVQVDRRQNTVRIRLQATRVGELSSGGLTGLSEAGSSSLVYQGPYDAKWYIREFAGGFAQKADRSSVTVTDANGRVRGTTRRWIFFRDYPEVLPGSTVTLRYKFEEPPEQKSDVDWDRVYNRTFQTLTTLLSLIILSRQF